MSNDPILEPLKALSVNKWSINTMKVLNEFPFAHFDNLTTLLVNAAVQQITKKAKGQSFKNLVKSTALLSTIIEQGDHHYYRIFRDAGLFNEHNQKFEEIKPLSRLLKELYNKLSGRNGKYSNQLIIYDDLLKHFLNGIELKLSVHDEIDQYKHWKCIRSFFVSEWRLPDRWLAKIPKEYLRKEAHKFNSVSNSTSLSQLADFGPTKKRNRPAIKEYLQLFEETIDFTSLKHLKALTEGNEYISLRNDRYFDLSLLEALDAGEWLILMDKLRYPIVQDHAFIFIRSLDFYDQLTAALVDPGFIPTTPKTVLLFIILKNYLEFVFNIGYEISNYESGRAYYDHPNLNQIQALAVEIKTQWLNETLSGSFRKIIGAVLPGEKLDNDLGLLLFEWFSEQLPEEYPQFVQPIRNDSIKAMDKVFKELISQHISNSVFLLKNVPIDVYNWKYFDLLSSTDFAEHNEDNICEGIIKKHLDYLRSSKFKWNNANIFNDYFINQAYHFSYLLLVYPNVYDYWLDLYDEFKIYHEGWNYNVGSDYIQFRKECYIFCTGIGIAFLLFTKGRKDEAKTIIEAIFPMILSQIRQNKRYTQFYLTPTCFVIEYYKQFDTFRLSAIILILIEKIDSIKLLLNILGDIITPEAAANLPVTTRGLVLSRVESDFFIINDRPDLMGLREEKLIYTGLRDKLYKVLG
jgi:hypothetical protein